MVKDEDAAIEVELGKSNVAGNIRRNSKEFGKIVVTSDNKKLLDSWKRENTTPNVCFVPIKKVLAVFEKKEAKNN